LEADENVPKIKTSTLEEVRQKLNIQRFEKASSEGIIVERPKGLVDRGNTRKTRIVLRNENQNPNLPSFPEVTKKFSFQHIQ
jgi:hypothetical protein